MADKNKKTRIIIVVGTSKFRLKFSMTKITKFRKLISKLGMNGDIQLLKTSKCRIKF